jgi:hypothetical protein
LANRYRLLLDQLGGRRLRAFGPVTPGGVALGLVGGTTSSREDETFGVSEARKRKPIEGKETRRWLGDT